MIWLVSQIWFLILLGALGGFLIGWALRCRKCEHDTAGLKKSLEKAYGNQYTEPEELRVSGGVGHSLSHVSNGDKKYSELLNQLSAEREEVAGLKAKLTLAGATGQNNFSHSYTGLSAFSGSADVDTKDGQLRWRNRYLESRVRFLESKISDLEVTIENKTDDDLTAVAIISKEETVKGAFAEQPIVINEATPTVSELIEGVEDLPEGVLIGADNEGRVESIASSEGLKTQVFSTTLETNKGRSEVNDSEIAAVDNFAEARTDIPDDLEMVDVQSLVWRNRYLEGRVKYLEEDKQNSSGEEIKVSQVDSLVSVKETKNADNELEQSWDNSQSVTDLSSKSDEEFERLRWRTRYLEGRIRFLEEEAAKTSLEIEKSSIEPKLSYQSNDKEVDRVTLERTDWRNKYLEERLRYLSEGKSASIQNGEQEPTVDKPLVAEFESKPSISAERHNWREAYQGERIRYAQSQYELEKSKKSAIPELVTNLDMDRLRWRTAYLDERIGYHRRNGVEQKAIETSIGQPKTIVKTVVETVSVRPDGYDDDLNELARLRWRDKYYGTLRQLQLSGLNDNTMSNVTTALEGVSSENVQYSDMQAKLQRFEWRNRFLSGRMKYLEENVALATNEIEVLRSKTDIPNFPTEDNEKSSHDTTYGDESDTTRLKWRNSYLMGRIGYLEEDKSTQEQTFVRQEKTDGKPGDALDNLEALSELKEQRSSNNENSDNSEISSGAEYRSSSVANRSSERTKRSSRKSRQSKSSRKREGGTVRKETSVTAETFQDSFKKSEYFVEGDKVTGRPAYLTQPLLGDHDDLREIAGVGPKIERILHDLGIYHFYQIAAWTRREVEWVDNYLTFKGRIDRENWIEQSKKLARGEETDGQRKYRAGKHT